MDVKFPPAIVGQQTVGPTVGAFVAPELAIANLEYHRLLDQYHEAWDNLFVQTLREYGEHAIAALFQSDPDRFQERHEAGRQVFHGPLPPVWIEEFVEAVACCLEADEPMGPCGYRWREEEGFWEIDMYPTPVELVGGAVDGAVVSPGYSVDLVELQSLLEHIDALTWNTHGHHGSEPAFIALEGECQGRELYLRLLPAAPDDEEPGLKVKVAP